MTELDRLVKEMTEKNSYRATTVVPVVKERGTINICNNHKEMDIFNIIPFSSGTPNADFHVIHISDLNNTTFYFTVTVTSKKQQ